MSQFIVKSLCLINKAVHASRLLALSGLICYKPMCLSGVVCNVVYLLMFLFLCAGYLFIL